ncbi:GL27010 [Drosophila persimilis]|uniref:GL27010 n=1 Tax=Drosophila persimilis TaxID=7234 RepID=B4H7E9_DROPE|nr:GL27010 [Drosophila persimilis]
MLEVCGMCLGKYFPQCLYVICPYPYSYPYPYLYPYECEYPYLQVNSELAKSESQRRGKRKQPNASGATTQRHSAIGPVLSCVLFNLSRGDVLKTVPELSALVLRCPAIWACDRT